MQSHSPTHQPTNPPTKQTNDQRTQLSPFLLSLCICAHTFLSLFIFSLWLLLFSPSPSLSTPHRLVLFISLIIYFLRFLPSSVSYSTPFSFVPCQTIAPHHPNTLTPSPTNHPSPTAAATLTTAPRLPPTTRTYIHSPLYHYHPSPIPWPLPHTRHQASLIAIPAPSANPPSLSHRNTLSPSFLTSSSCLTSCPNMSLPPQTTRRTTTSTIHNNHNNDINSSSSSNSTSNIAWTCPGSWTLLSKPLSSSRPSIRMASSTVSSALPLSVGKSPPRSKRLSSHPQTPLLQLLRQRQLQRTLTPTNLRPLWYYPHQQPRQLPPVARLTRTIPSSPSQAP